MHFVGTSRNVGAHTRESAELQLACVTVLLDNGANPNLT
jgi:hypothetical protein